MTVTERLGDVIVVRSSNPAGRSGAPECGETLNRVSLAWMKKYSSPKPLFRPKTWKERQEEAKEPPKPGDE